MGRKIVTYAIDIKDPEEFRMFLDLIFRVSNTNQTFKLNIFVRNFDTFELVLPLHILQQTQVLTIGEYHFEYLSEKAELKVGEIYTHVMTPNFPFGFALNPRFDWAHLLSMFLRDNTRAVNGSIFYIRKILDVPIMRIRLFAFQTKDCDDPLMNAFVPFKYDTKGASNFTNSSDLVMKPAVNSLKEGERTFQHYGKQAGYTQLWTRDSTKMQYFLEIGSTTESSRARLPEASAPVLPVVTTIFKNSNQSCSSSEPKKPAFSLYYTEPKPSRPSFYPAQPPLSQCETSQPEEENLDPDILRAIEESQLTILLDEQNRNQKLNELNARFGIQSSPSTNGSVVLLADDAPPIQSAPPLKTTLSDDPPPAQSPAPKSNKGKDCCMCLEIIEDFEDLRFLVCKHVFCVVCVVDWFNKSPKPGIFICPKCRHEIPHTGPAHTLGKYF